MVLFLVVVMLVPGHAALRRIGPVPRLRHLGAILHCLNWGSVQAKFSAMFALHNNVRLQWSSCKFLN
jgi:hypothetical protein